MNGQHRLRFGHDHERRVKRELERRGWHVQPWGQGLMDEVVRQALTSKTPEVLWRWIPDLIAVRGARVLLVDPKSQNNPEAPTIAIEINAVQAHQAMSPLGLRVVYVFGDLSCNYAERLQPIKWHTPDPGRSRVVARGSGTPYMVIRRSEQIPLNQLFGEPLSGSQAS